LQKHEVAKVDLGLWRGGVTAARSSRRPGGELIDKFCNVAISRSGCCNCCILVL
jgi:hypothetical protein